MRRRLSYQSLTVDLASSRFIISRDSTISSTSGVGTLRLAAENFSRLHRKTFSAVRRSKTLGPCNQRTLTVLRPASTISGFSHEYISGKVMPHLSSISPMMDSTTIIKLGDTVSSSDSISGCLPGKSFCSSRIIHFENLQGTFASPPLKPRRCSRGLCATVVTGRTPSSSGLGPDPHLKAITGPLVRSIFYILMNYFNFRSLSPSNILNFLIGDFVIFLGF